MPHDRHQSLEHHHHGITQKSMALYRASLQFVGEHFIGRANAGRVGRAARIVRIGSTVISLGVGVAAIVIITSAVTSGAAVPVWLFILGGSMVAINSAAIGIGAAANHMKISQYYDRQAEMHANNESLRLALEQESQPLPHGMREYWQHERPLFNMVSARRVHDTNGVAGTTISVISGLLSLGVAPISPDAAIALFIVTRSSSVLSSTGAQGTNWHRLRAYRRIILRFGDDYRRLTQEHNPITAALSEKMVADVLQHIHFKENSPYAGLLKFHLYKAIFTVAAHHRQHSTLSPLNENQWHACVDAMVNTLQPFLKEHHGRHRVSRSRLQKIDREHEYTMEPKHGFMDKQSVFDSLFVLEMMLRVTLMKQVMPEMAACEAMADEVIQSLKIKTTEDLAAKRLRFQIISAIYETTRETMPLATMKEKLQQSIENAISPYLKAETERVEDGRKWLGLRHTHHTEETGTKLLNHDKLVEDYPVGQHAHGDNFHTNFHMEMLREKMRAELATTYKHQVTATKKAPQKIKKRVKRRVKKSQRLFEGSMNTGDNEGKTTHPRSSTLTPHASAF